MANTLGAPTLSTVLREDVVIRGVLMTFMTAHELARLLLEGPDLPVFYYETIQGDLETKLVEETRPVTLYQANYGGAAGWGLSLLCEKPKVHGLEIREVKAISLL